ncbi:tyrosine-type recombinase/integrase [Bacillus sp. OV322]|uniref:tyrosine-type recombinase/integrase n=1 Tax=Bacillus sp. OV322 TaxID=1882764 RepID=UPI000B82D4A7|nr:tyrosine-type recombinase/integrase [Bacillus sp. OV322]
MSGIETPKTDDKLPVYITLRDLQQLFRSLEQDDSTLSKRNEIMFKLLAVTDMRRSELVSLTWSQLDFSNQTIRIYGKGKKERLLPLPPLLIFLLSTYKDSLDSYQSNATEPVFLNKDGKPLNPRGIPFKDVMKRSI